MSVQSKVEDELHKAKEKTKGTAEKAESDIRGTEGRSDRDEEKISPVMENEIEQAQWRAETKMRDVKEIDERNTREATEGLTRDVDISTASKPSETKWKIKKESEK
jgi:hypothetical protein